MTYTTMMPTTAELKSETIDKTDINHTRGFAYLEGKPEIQHKMKLGAGN